MARPVVFVSSTVHDLGDMRSAIRYWLEQWGYEVRLNEYPDFPDVVDKDSYEACLDAVRDADYCIVLIGNRAGGLYDKDAGVTITRQEYRTAYEGAQEGRTKILVFVRDEIWTVFQDRKPLDDQHSSSVITCEHAKLVFPFIEEARRAAEMREALEGVADRPTNNWVFTFKGFEDIATAVRTQLRIDRPIRRAALEANLMMEALEALRAMACVGEGGAVRFDDEFAYATLHDLQSREKELHGEVHLGRHCLLRMWQYSMFAQGSLLVQLPSLDLAIDSGEYLEVDRHSGRLRPGRVYHHLNELRLLVSWWHRAETCEVLQEFQRRCPRGEADSIDALYVRRLLAVWECHRRLRIGVGQLVRFLATGDDNHLEVPAPSPESVVPSTMASTSVRPVSHAELLHRVMASAP